jgi:hypothetical protein
MMYDRLKDLLVNENQFSSRPGGDGTGRKKGAEAVSAVEKRKETTSRRQSMPEKAEDLRRLIRRGR